MGVGWQEEKQQSTGIWDLRSVVFKMEILHHTSAPGNDPPTAAESRGGEVGQRGLGLGRWREGAALPHWKVHPW